MWIIFTGTVTRSLVDNQNFQYTNLPKVKWHNEQTGDGDRCDGVDVRWEGDKSVRLL